jgi:predicted O-methyltransferase YrrM
MSNEHDFSRGVNPLCPNDELWATRDEQSSEDEVNDFLYALIRLVKPQFVVETGCYLGDGTVKIAQALKENGRGRILTCDTEKERVDMVNNRLIELGYQDISEGKEPIAVALCCTGLNLIKQCGSMIDFAFIDSSPEGKIRGEEITELLKTLRPMKMFALHDTAPQHPQINGVSNSVANLVGLSHVFFNTPRGLTLFAKK